MDNLRRYLLGAVLVSLTLMQQAVADQLELIRRNGEVRIAVPEAFPPFGMRSGDGNLVGLDIEVARLVAGKLGVKPVLVAVPSSERLPALTGGRVDLVISSLGKNPEREQQIDFSRAYAPFFLGVFGPARERVIEPGDLSGKRIAVTRGGVEDTELTRIAPADAKIQRFGDNKETLASYLKGDSELIASGSSAMWSVGEQHPERAPVMLMVLKNSPNYIGMRKGESALKAQLDGILEKARSDGSLDDICMQWLGRKLPKNL